MRIAVIALITLFPFICVPEQKKKKIFGKAEYCVITEELIECTDHNMNQCLRTLFLTPNGIVCLPREEAIPE